MCILHPLQRNHNTHECVEGDLKNIEFANFKRLVLEIYDYFPLERMLAVYNKSRDRAFGRHQTNAGNVTDQSQNGQYRGRGRFRGRGSHFRGRGSHFRGRGRWSNRGDDFKSNERSKSKEDQATGSGAIHEKIKRNNSREVSNKDSCKKSTGNTLNRGNDVKKSHCLFKCEKPHSTKNCEKFSVLNLSQSEWIKCIRKRLSNEEYEQELSKGVNFKQLYENLKQQLEREASKDKQKSVKVTREIPAEIKDFQESFLGQRPNAPNTT